MAKKKKAAKPKPKRNKAAKPKPKKKKKLAVKPWAHKKSRYMTDILPNLEAIKGWLRSSYTEASIAKRLGMGRSTWERHKAEQAEFREAVHEGRQDAGALAVNYLFKRVTGYTYQEVTVEERPAPLRKGKPPSKIKYTKTVTKHIAPDVAACCFFIVNRLSEFWQHIQHIQHHGEPLDILSDEDCDKIRELMRANHDEAEPEK